MIKPSKFKTQAHRIRVLLAFRCICFQSGISAQSGGSSRIFNGMLAQSGIHPKKEIRCYHGNIIGCTARPSLLLTHPLNWISAGDFGFEPPIIPPITQDHHSFCLDRILSARLLWSRQILCYGLLLFINKKRIWFWSLLLHPISGLCDDWVIRIWFARTKLPKDTTKGIANRSICVARNRNR